MIPARNEAEILPMTLPSLLGQDYRGRFAIVLVDDDSGDGTGKVAEAAGQAAGWRIGQAAPRGGPGRSSPQGGASLEDRTLQVLRGSATPPGWAGKVWAMSQGVASAGQPQFILFTDADIEFAPGALAALAAGAAGDDLAPVSQMALLRAASGWERLPIPAFVYFFAQLYPFPRVSRTRSRTAAAAGGCMLVRADVLARAGGLSKISSARIDDVALGRAGQAGRWTLLAEPDHRGAERAPGTGARRHLGHGRAQRLHPAALLGRRGRRCCGWPWLALPGCRPVAAIGGIAALAAGGSAAAAWLTAAGLAGWALMTVSYLPMLRLYRLSPLRAPALPLIAALYAAMTARLSLAAPGRPGRRVERPADHSGAVAAATSASASACSALSILAGSSPAARAFATASRSNSTARSGWPARQLGLAKRNQPARNPPPITEGFAQLVRAAKVPHRLCGLARLDQVVEADVPVNFRLGVQVGPVGQVERLPEVRHGGGPVMVKHLVDQPEAEQRAGHAGRVSEPG